MVRVNFSEVWSWISRKGDVIKVFICYGRGLDIFFKSYKELLNSFRKKEIRKGNVFENIGILFRCNLRDCRDYVNNFC